MNSKFNKYKNFSVHDFVLDVDFIAWSKQLPEGDNDFWSAIPDVYPAQADNIVAARNFLLNVTVKDKSLTPEQQQMIWKRIELNLFPAKQKSIIHRLNWLKVAAVVFIVVGMATIAYHLTPTEAEVQTVFAETRQIELPDHSKITLNANSTIRYSKSWNSGQPREVWLSGEAYFEVKHLQKSADIIQPGDRFIVHANGVDVEVLGTSFNINNRHGAAKVALTSGKIELKFPDQHLPSVVLLPGDVVSYTKGATKIEKKKESPLQVSSWKDQQWTFNKSSLKEVLQLLKDNFGLEAKVENDELWKQTVSGSISSGNSQIVIQGLSILLDITIEQKGDTLFLKK